jgi:hypothetical protein
MLPVKATFVYTADDLQKAYMLHFNKKIPFKSRKNLFIALGLIAAGCLIYFFDVFNGELTWICWFLMGYGVMLMAVYYYRLLTIGKKYFKNLPQEKNKFPYIFSREGIFFEGEKTTQIKWDHFYAALITDKMVLLYASETKFNIFPRRCFSDAQYEEFTNLVRQNIANWK